MTLAEFFYEIEREPATDYIVLLQYRYSWEKEFTESKEILVADPQYGYLWLNDWNEGQEHVEVLGYIPIDQIEVPIKEVKI